LGFITLSIPDARFFFRKRRNSKRVDDVIGCFIANKLHYAAAVALSALQVLQELHSVKQKWTGMKVLLGDAA
jgi:hypothetical protein